MLAEHLGERERGNGEGRNIRVKRTRGQEKGGMAEGTGYGTRGWPEVGQKSVREEQEEDRVEISFGLPGGEHVLSHCRSLYLLLAWR